MASPPDKDELIRIIDNHLAVVLEFNPYRKFEGVDSQEQFIRLMGTDPAFRHFGLDDKRYVVGKMGGNLITSLHRKLGDLYQEVFTYLLRCRFDLGDDLVNYGIVLTVGGRKQKRSTDGMIPVGLLRDVELNGLQMDWRSLDGLAFEVRSCYQIGDSKRIQADRDMALVLKKRRIIPLMLIFCNMSLREPVERLKKIWTLFEGDATFDFVEQLTNFNLRGFFNSNAPRFKATTDKIFSMFS